MANINHFRGYYNILLFFFRLILYILRGIKYIIMFFIVFTPFYYRGLTVLFIFYINYRKYSIKKRLSQNKKGAVFFY